MDMKEKNLAYKIRFFVCFCVELLKNIWLKMSRGCLIIKLAKYTIVIVVAIVAVLSSVSCLKEL